MILLLAATWLFAMPALVGQYVRVWVPEWLAEIEASEDSDFQPGWFRSALDVSPGNDVHARLYARHMPPTGLSWLRLGGEIDIPQSTESASIQGHLDLNGRIRLVAEGRQLTLSQQPRFQTGTLEVNLDQHPEGSTRLQTDLTGLAWSDTVGNQLEFDQAVTVMDWQALGPEDASLTFSAHFTRQDRIVLELVVTAAPLEINALGQFVDGIRQLIGAPPDSMARQMAFLTIAGAWQELSRHGLEIELERLAVGPSSEFTGQWETTSEMPRLTGQGQSDDLLDFLTPMVALSRTQPLTLAEHQVREWFQTMIRQQVLQINENGAFRFQYPPNEGLDQH